VDYFQGVVADYLGADPAVFVQPEACIRLHPDRALKKGEHWYCDILAVNFREQTVYLCEVTLSRTLTALLKRLREWDERWTGVCAALSHDNRIPDGWNVLPWVFVPSAQKELLSHGVSALLGADADADADRMPRPLVTGLEDVVPWLYSWPNELPGKTAGLA
jgi:hypothetical protein